MKKKMKEIKNKGLFDIICYSENGEITEGTRSNVFFKIKKKLYTPPLKNTILPGVLRAHLISKGICEEKELKLNDARDMKTIYLGNSVRGLVKCKIKK